MSSRTRNPQPQNLDNISSDLDKLTLKLKRIEPNPNLSPEHKSEVNLEQEPKAKKHVSFFPPDLLQSRPEPPKSAPIQVPFRPVPISPAPSRHVPISQAPSRPVPFAPHVTHSNNRGNRWNMSFR